MKRKRAYCCALSRTAPLWVVFGWFRRRSVLSALHTDKHGTPLPARTATPKNRADGVAVGCWVRSEGLTRAGTCTRVRAREDWQTVAHQREPPRLTPSKMPTAHPYTGVIT